MGGAARGPTGTRAGRHPARLSGRSIQLGFPYGRCIISPMQKIWQRLGSLPYLLLGIVFLYAGSYTLIYIVDNVWLFDVNRLDLVRAVAQDRTDAPALLDAAYTDVILSFLAALGTAVMGLTLPLLYFINKRFVTPQPRFIVVLRQSAWLGGWAAFCSWLQMNRAFGLAVAVLVIGVFVLLEVLLQLRARTRNLPLKFARE